MNRMRKEGAGRTRRYCRADQYDVPETEWCSTYVLVRSRQSAFRLRKRLLCCVCIQGRLILNEQSRPLESIRLVVLIFDVVTVHVAAESADSIKLAFVEHLAELLELVLGLIQGYSTLFLVEHALEGFEICCILEKTRDIDLSADEVAEITSRVEERRLHEQIHKG